MLCLGISRLLWNAGLVFKLNHEWYSYMAYSISISISIEYAMYSYHLSYIWTSLHQT